MLPIRCSVGVTGIEPMSHPPHGRILPLYYTPTLHLIPTWAHITTVLYPNHGLERSFGLPRIELGPHEPESCTLPLCYSPVDVLAGIEKVSYHTSHQWNRVENVTCSRLPVGPSAHQLCDSFSSKNARSAIATLVCGPVAQLARAPVLHSGGRGFKSSRVHISTTPDANASGVDAL